MPLHDRDTIRAQFEGCVFADRDLTRPVAKYRFPQEGRCRGMRFSWSRMS